MVEILVTRKVSLLDRWCSRCRRKFANHEYCHRCGAAVGRYTHPIKIDGMLEFEHHGGSELHDGLCDLCRRDEESMR